MLEIIGIKKKFAEFLVRVPFFKSIGRFQKVEKSEKRRCGAGCANNKAHVALMPRSPPREMREMLGKCISRISRPFPAFPEHFPTISRISRAFPAPREMREMHFPTFPKSHFRGLFEKFEKV